MEDEVEKPIELDDNDSDNVMLIKAMHNAREAFNKTFSDNNIDAAYYQIDMIGWSLNTETFEPFQRIEDIDYSSGSRKYPDWEFKDEDK